MFSPNTNPNRFMLGPNTNPNTSILPWVPVKSQYWSRYRRFKLAFGVKTIANVTNNALNWDQVPIPIRIHVFRWCFLQIYIKIQIIWAGIGSKYLNTKPTRSVSIWRPRNKSQQSSVFPRNCRLHLSWGKTALESTWKSKLVIIHFQTIQIPKPP